MSFVLIVIIANHTYLPFRIFYESIAYSFKKLITFSLRTIISIEKVMWSYKNWFCVFGRNTRLGRTLTSKMGFIQNVYKFRAKRVFRVQLISKKIFFEKCWKSTFILVKIPPKSVFNYLQINKLLFCALYKEFRNDFEIF